MPEGLQGTLLKELVDLLRIHSRHAQLFQCAAAGIIIAAVNGRGHGDKGRGPEARTDPQHRPERKGTWRRSGHPRRCNGPAWSGDPPDCGKPLNCGTVLVGQLLHKADRGADCVAKLFRDSVPLTAQGFDHFQNRGSQALIIEAEVFRTFHSPGIQNGAAQVNNNIGGIERGLKDVDCGDATCRTRR